MRGVACEEAPKDAETAVATKSVRIPIGSSFCLCFIIASHDDCGADTMTTTAFQPGRLSRLIAGVGRTKTK